MMNKIFPHIHTHKVLFVLNYCSKRYNHVVERILPLTENLLPRVWLYSTAYLGVSQSVDSIVQRKRTTDRRCKLLQRPPFLSISSLTPIRGPLVIAAISGHPAPLLETLTTAAGWWVMTLCFPHGHHHTALWRPRQDSLRPLGPHTLSAASRCLCSALEPSRFLTVGLSEGLCKWMHCFISSCVNRNGPLPLLHFTPWLCSAVVHFTASRTPHGFPEAAVFTRQWAALHRPHGTRKGGSVFSGGKRFRQWSGLHIWIQGSSPSFEVPRRADAPGCAPGSGALCLLRANRYLCPPNSKQPSTLPTLLPVALPASHGAVTDCLSDRLQTESTLTSAKFRTVTKTAEPGVQTWAKWQLGLLDSELTA